MHRKVKPVGGKMCEACASYRLKRDAIGVGYCIWDRKTVLPGECCGHWAKRVLELMYRDDTPATGR